MINLGLNRKISNVLSKNLNDPESDIYKEISNIAGETTESDSSVNTVRKIIEDGKNQITRFYDDTLVGVSNDFFNDFDNLEEIYLLNVVGIKNKDYGSYVQTIKICLNCSKLKKFIIPKANPTKYIRLDNGIANLPIEIMALNGNIENGGMFNGYPLFSSLETLILTTCSGIGHSGLSIDKFPNLHNLILPSKNYDDYYDGFWCENIYVPNIMIEEYNARDMVQFKPLSALPDNLKHELKLCGINTEDEDNTIKSFVNEEIIELDDCAFRNYYNLEYVNLPNCTKLGTDSFKNCTSLKTLLLPSVTEITNSFTCLDGLSNLEVLDLSSYNNNNFDSEYMYYYDIDLRRYLEYNSENLLLPKLKILSYGVDGLGDGGGYLGWNELEILILPNLKHLGASSCCIANTIILPSSQVVSSSGGGTLTGTIYVNDNILSEYQNHEKWHYWYDRGEILPISQLPQEIREELELCQIQI